MVVLHKSEADFKTDVDIVQAKLRSFYGEGKWLGFTSECTISLVVTTSRFSPYLSADHL